MTPKRIAIIGGGISGLTAAYELAKARRGGVPVEEFLIEASPRLGGALRTERVEGCLVEAGADSFLTEKREASELCEELGLGRDLIGSNDARRTTYILHRSRLAPLPEGLEFFLPVRLRSILGTPLLSWKDKLAVVMEFFQRPRKGRADESVASFVERHFGRGLLDTVVEPLLGAVYGGDPAELSARAVLPRLVELERKWGSLVRAMRRAPRPAASKRPALFTTLRNGLDMLVATLEQQLETARVLCLRRVVAVGRSAAGFEVHFEKSESLPADAVILALPAYEAARLVGSVDAALAAPLAEIPYSSSLIVAVAYDAAVAVRLPPGFGFLVPHQEGGRLRACTFLDQKFSHRVPATRRLLRCFYGGIRDEAVLELGDAEVEAMVRKDLAGILGLAAEPLFIRVYRWPKAVAQYTVGHLERLAAVQARVSAQRGLFLCGNAFEGIGIADCIRSGRIAARMALLELQSG